MSEQEDFIALEASFQESLDDASTEAQINMTRAAIEKVGPVKVFSGYLDIIKDSIKKIDELARAMEKEGPIPREAFQILAREIILLTRQLYLTERGIEQAKIYEEITETENRTIN
jgi:hypothetical protein